MELHARMFFLCLLCIASASNVLPQEVAELKAEPSSSESIIEDLLGIPVQETNGSDQQPADNSRDKRALGLLLSGLAQIFGYTVTPIQFASLPNPNVTRPVAMSKAGVAVQQTASSRPTNATVPKQQETIRFTGVLNFGNNSNILGHLRQYEQIFHGPRSNTTATTTATMTTSRPATLPAKIALDPQINSQTKPPLLAPFFVKIPLPIAPDLLPISPLSVPAEDIGLTYQTVPVSTASGSEENAETPVRKEQEVVYRSNEDTERYTVEEKDIYDEKDVMKPADSPRVKIDEPSRDKQLNKERGDLQRKQEDRVKLEPKEEKKNHDKAADYSEEETNERYKNREKEITGRNREHVSKNESTESKPARDDEEDEGSAERHEDYASGENLSNESSKQSSKEEKEQNENYSTYNDLKQFSGYKHPENFEKYVEYNQQLPIGDYFHENNPEVIRDSYGEVLDDKKLEDDRIAGYVSMFKHPYVQTDDSRRAHAEDASREENERETSEDGYDEHLIRLQKLREEYAPPENKYEEYDLNDDSEADRGDRESEIPQNRTPTKSKRPKAERVRDKEDSHPGRPTNELENARSQEEVDFARYVPLIVPIRYVNANDKPRQASAQRLNYKETDKSTHDRLRENDAGPARTVLKESLTPQIGPPERPRQLHEGEHKELHAWPPPFDYAFDNTQSVTHTVVPPNSRIYYPQNYAPNYYQHVMKDTVTQNARDGSTEQPSGYVVVVDNPGYPYRYPYNVYYFSNEVVNSRNQAPHLNTEAPRPQNQVYVAQQTVDRQTIRVKPNVTEYKLNETTSSPRNYYYQSQNAVPTNTLDHYKYDFGDRAPQVKEPLNVDVRNPIFNSENWSNRIYRTQSPSTTIEEPPRPVFTQLQNIAPSNRNVPNGLPRSSRHSRMLRRVKKSVQQKDHRENDKNNSTKAPQILINKPFNDPQTAHDFFGFSKDDYNFGIESDAMKVAEEEKKTVEKSLLDSAEPVAYQHDDESIVKDIDEPENDTDKAKVKEYRNKVATLKVSERRQLKPNGPIEYVDFTRSL
ncbi:hypothetical protein PUN28_011420 [Cardiocondyla obscurior]|uniref:Uncharacterized protein n=1 Tax=Cardiocondyla obscurior TaxID=286306 RepID=A0AAW2FG76_9HYME